MVQLFERKDTVYVIVMQYLYIESWINVNYEKIGKPKFYVRDFSTPSW